MKKGLFLFIALLAYHVTTLAQSYQYQPLVDSATTKVWRIGCSFSVQAMGGGTIYINPVVILKGDTTINAIHCRKVIDSTNQNMYLGCIWEDSLHKVFFLNSYDTGISKAMLFFDFSLHINDTFFTSVNYFGKLIIRSIDTVLVNNTLRKRFDLAPISSTNNIHDTWVEGIGSLIYGLHPGYYCQRSYSLCAEYDDTTLIYSSDYCSPTQTITDIIDKSDVNIFPNPTMGEITITLNNIMQPSSAWLTDIEGRQIMQIYNNQQHATYTFNTNNISAGVYFLKVVNSAGKTYITKMIKQ